MQKKTRTKKDQKGPKRVIKLKHCFNINRRLDTKHNFVIVLSSRDGGFGVVLDSENEMRKWLDALMALQRCNEINMSNFGKIYMFQQFSLTTVNTLLRRVLGKFLVCIFLELLGAI